MIGRRSFLKGLAATLVAAPFVVRNSGVLMPIKDRTLYRYYLVKGYDQHHRPVETTIRMPKASYLEPNWKFISELADPVQGFNGTIFTTRNPLDPGYWTFHG